MKKAILIFTLMMISVSFSYGQFTFGVSPGIGMNSAYFGYKFDNKFVPYVGFQYLNAKFKYEESGQRYDYDINQIVSYTEDYEISGSLYMPNIGLKYFVKQQNKIQAYLSLNLAKPILSGRIKYDGEEDEDFKEDIKSISMWGGEFGFGVEYFFDENFSLGGEFGIRYVHFIYERSTDVEIYDPNSGGSQSATIEESFNFNASPTFSKISLNYYF